jgi:hypothetical protein
MRVVGLPPRLRTTIDVEAPATYEPERRYVLDVVLSEWLGLDWRLRLGDRSDVRITLGGEPDRSLVLPDTLFGTPPAQWLTPSSLPAAPLAWCELPSIGPSPLTSRSRLPVLYGTAAPVDPLLVRRADTVEMAVDVFGSCFFMLTRYEEFVVRVRDRYGRFAGSSSTAYREGFLRLPIVDAYVELLWVALEQLWPRLQRKPRRFDIALSHDVDRPLASLGRRAPALVRQLGADALVRLDPPLAVRRLRSWSGMRRGDYRLDPYNTFDFLMDVSERHGIVSAFYFLAIEEATQLDGLYTLEHPWIESLLRGIQDRGHEIGLQGSFNNYLDPEGIESEFARLRRAAEQQGAVQEQWGGRQHYLRWENPYTWASWDRAGLDYDSTLTYADQIGFRVGTCHEFPVFDLRGRRPLHLRERPLHVMDGTLFEYMKLVPDTAFEAVIALAAECRRYGGTLALLWHNSSLPTARQKRWYEAMVSAVSGHASSPSLGGRRPLNR